MNKKDNFAEFESAVTKKAFELAYALWRTAEVMRHSYIAQYLERYATDILDASLQDDRGRVVRNLAAASHFLRLAENVGLIHGTHTELMLSEMAGLETALQSALAVSPAVPDMTGVFTPLNLDELARRTEPASGRQSSAHQPPQQAPSGKSLEKALRPSPIPSQPASASSGGSGERREVIMRMVRQMNNCRLADIQAVLPNVSERTIRYDVQALVESGQLQRVGHSGPATFYRLPKAFALPDSAEKESRRELLGSPRGAA